MCIHFKCILFSLFCIVLYTTHKWPFTILLVTFYHWLLQKCLDWCIWCYIFILEVCYDICEIRGPCLHALLLDCIQFTVTIVVPSVNHHLNTAVLIGRSHRLAWVAMHHVQTWQTVSSSWSSASTIRLRPSWKSAYLRAQYWDLCCSPCTAVRWPTS